MMARTNALEEIGRTLWLVNFMADCIGDTGVNFSDGEGGDDATHQVWADAIFENYEMLKGAVAELKGAMLLLPPEMAEQVASAYAKADAESKALGDVSCFLANIQREASERKGGAA